MNKTFLGLLILIMYSCNSNSKGVKDIDLVVPVHAINSDSIFHLIDRALNSGDGKAYNKASYYFFINDKYEDFLYPAIIMANKHNSPEAFFHVYKILNGVRNHQKIDELDLRTKNLSIFYLLKAHELGYKDAEYEIRKIFHQIDTIPESSYYLRQLEDQH